MAYVVNKSDGTLLVTIPDGVVENTESSIALLGKGFNNYGEIVAENWVHMLENFASEDQPKKPLQGQVWYDKNSFTLKVNEGTPDAPNFVNVGGSDISGNSINDLSDVNTSLVSQNDVLTWNGTNWVPGSAGATFPSATRGQILVADTNGDFQSSSNWVSLTDITIQAANLTLTASGTLSVNSNQIKNVVDPSAAQDAATKNYVDSQVSLNSVTTLSGLSDVNTAGASTGSVLKFDGANWVVGTDDSGAGGSTTLSGLSDVNTAGASTGSVLKFDGANWVVGTDDNSTTLGGLTDVDTTGAVAGSVIKFDGANWVVGTDVVGGSGGGGTVTSVGLNDTSGDFDIAGSPVTTFGNIDLGLSNTTVTAGSYTNADITVDAKGRITAASNGSAIPTGSQGQILVADGSGDFVTSTNWSSPNAFSLISDTDFNLELNGPAGAIRLRSGAEGVAESTLLAMDQGSSASLKYYASTTAITSGLNIGENSASLVAYEGQDDQMAFTLNIGPKQGGGTRNELNIRHYQPLSGTGSSNESIISLGLGSMELWTAGPGVSEANNVDTLHTLKMHGGIQVPNGTNLQRPTGTLTAARTTSTNPLGDFTSTTPDARNTLGIIRWNTQAGSGSGVLEVANSSNADASGSGWRYITTSATAPDYAELFETHDGLALPIGTTVVMDTTNPGFIRAAQAGEEAQIFGVVRPNNVEAMVLGDYVEWPEKFQMDDYNGFIVDVYERRLVLVEILNDNGDVINSSTQVFLASDTLPSGPNIRTTVQKEFTEEEKRLNPLYDDSQMYVSRRQRPEWQVVGIMGQIPVTKGQPVNPAWIYMKEVSATVDMYLVKG